MYDSLSEDYDRFVSWSGRLAFEMPFIEKVLSQVKPVNRPLQVLDSACGTGMHTIELSRRGYIAAGADLSAGMIARARENARSAGVSVDFRVAGFGELASHFQGFDAVLCLGNSLPHILTEEALQASLQDFAGCLRTGGLLLIQNRNFDAVMAQRERWMGPESHREEDEEWVFLRFYDFDPDGRITFNIVTLHRKGHSVWEQKVDSTRLYPQVQAELTQSLRKAGFQIKALFGGMNGEPFNPQTSGNLVISAILASSS